MNGASVFCWCCCCSFVSLFLLFYFVFFLCFLFCFCFVFQSSSHPELNNGYTSLHSTEMRLKMVRKTNRLAMMSKLNNCRLAAQRQAPVASATLLKSPRQPVFLPGEGRLIQSSGILLSNEPSESGSSSHSGQR